MVKETRKIQKSIQMPLVITTCIVVSLVVGLAIGSKYGSSVHPKTPKATKALQSTDAGFRIATSADKDKALHQIKSQFRMQSTVNCGDDTVQEDREKVFDQYLKINKYANRAVIRGCSYTDTLLAKNPVKEVWEQTSVNIALDARANPVWRDECLASDILRADTQIRSENSTIDSYNLVECRMLKERDLMAYLQQKVGEKPTEKGIAEVIQSAEDSARMAQQ